MTTDIKGRDYSELKALRKFKNIKVEQFGRGCFIKKLPSKKDSATPSERTQGIRVKNWGLVSKKRSLPIDGFLTGASTAISILPP